MYKFNPDPNQLAYEVSKWDALQWEDYADAHPETQKPINTGKEKIPTFEIFATEIFHRLYAPEPKPLENPRPEDAWAVRSHSLLTELPEFDSLLTTIVVEAIGDSFKKWLLAGVGTTKFSDHIAKNLAKPRTPLTNPQPMRQQTLALKRQINSLSKEAPDAELDEKDPQKTEEIKQRLEELEQELKNVINEGKKSVVTAQKYAERLEQTGIGLKAVLEEALEAAQEAVEDAAIALSAFGWGDGNGFGSKGINSEQKIQLARRVAQNKKLQEIAKLAGRMKLLAASKQRTKTTELATEIYSVTTGNNLAHLVPSELMKLVVPELKPLFIKGYSEKSLLQYQLKSKEKQGRGPIVVCLDSSGSMSGAKEEWSKAVAIALLTIANQQKRTCRILHFCEDVCRVDDFQKGQLDPLKLVDCMECFYNGGTSWSAPLDSALAVIKSESHYKNADIILITDDQCSVSDTWLESFKQSQKILDFSTFGIMLGSSNTTALAQILDTVIAIPNLEQDREIETVFAI
ncbi:MAG TPA: VWA domain-containing protein [Oculatellaceae cyanobacterium]|jgi:uncharacterized protein with von Willebrand factor type A (vWA) domain